MALRIDYLTYLKLYRNINNGVLLNSTRKISKYLNKDVSSNMIRQRFLDYFINEKNHVFVRSSPVVPFFDSTVPFVNAGMNQFKSIFQGTQLPHFTRVANSQKCIRIAGKHNDINIVGNDGYHHTFFEMLGNWSFCGDYFKTEACQMAWELLTKIYKIPSSHLYVTYFGGDKYLDLQPDFETREIWKSLGVTEDRILKFGVSDNFWEMGLYGPCGPSTEIHYDYYNSNGNRAEFVNKGFDSLIEIWNIVFIEYNRYEDQNGRFLLETLPKKHIDTGLGFERLVCLLQGKQSTYDTDLFDYLIAAIQKNCNNIPQYSGKFGEADWNNLDTSYRVLSDHIRMIVVALADGVIPDENQKLRRIMRKCFTFNEKIFHKTNGLVKELSNYVVENLGKIYPEMERNINQIQQIIDFEEETYKLLRKAAKNEMKKLTKNNLERKIEKYDLSIDLTPSFVLAYKELENLNLSEIDNNVAYKLYDTYGLDSEAIEKLAKMFSINYNPESLNEKMQEIKSKSKEKHRLDSKNHLLFEELRRDNIKITNDSGKYYFYKNNENQYIFPDQMAKVLKIITEGNGNSASCSIVLDKTNFYSEAGGQESDNGTMQLRNGNVFNIDSITKLNGYILHNIRLKENGDPFQVGDEIILHVNAENRFNFMKNHTCLHLLNAALKQIKIATCQKSSKITSSFLNFDVAIFGSKLNIDDIVNVEKLISNLIRSKVDVKCIVTDSLDLYNSFNGITFVPGEIYPINDIRVVEIVDEHTGFVSREPCCGTHVLNTSDIEDFCIISMKSLGTSTVSLHAVTGQRAKLAQRNAANFIQDLNDLDKKLPATDCHDLNQLKEIDSTLTLLKQRLQFDLKDESILPVTSKYYISKEINKIENQLSKIAKKRINNFIDIEIAKALKTNIIYTKLSNKPYLVYHLEISMMLESVSLQKVVRKCPNIPLMIISCSDNLVKAKCCVPKEFQNQHFTAEKWLQHAVGNSFQSNVTPPKGQDPNYVCNMKTKKIQNENWPNLLNESLEKANEYINKYLL